MSSITDCLMIVGCTTAFAIAGLFVVRKRFSRVSLESCHEVGGFLLAVVGTLYAILVGLIVVSSQTKVDTASHMAVIEANMLSSIFHLAQTFKQPAQSKIHKHLYEYAVAATNQDWSLVEQGAEREATIPAYRELWKDVANYVPKEENESQCYSAMLGNIQQLSDARKYRMVEARSPLSPVLWSVLIAGGVMIILFTYFFFIESFTAQAVMTAFVAIFLSLNVYLIYVCQNPYRPELGAKEAGFGFSFTPNWFRDKQEQSQSDVRSKLESKSKSETQSQTGSKQ